MTTFIFVLVLIANAGERDCKEGNRPPARPDPAWSTKQIDVCSNDTSSAT
jgi:hypothetical protein